MEDKKTMDLKKRTAMIGWVMLFPTILTALANNSSHAGAIKLETIVVSSPKGEENDETEETIDSKTLKTHKIVDLAETLSDEMIEAALIRKSMYGNEVSIRGFGKSNLRVLIDGTIIEGACGGRKDPSLSLLSTLAIEKLVVREGPFDVTNPGALGGSIDVVKKRPEQGFHGEINIKGGRFDYVNAGGYLTGGNGFVQGLGGYNFSQSDQYKDGDGNPLSSFTLPEYAYKPEYLDMKAFKKQDAIAELQLTPTENQTILFSQIYSKGEDIMSPRYGWDIKEEKAYLTSGEYAITDAGRFSDQLTLQLYRNRVEHNPTTEFRITSDVAVMNNDVISTITGGKIENLQLTGFADVTYGIDAYKQHWFGDVYKNGVLVNGELIPGVDTVQTGLFIMAEKDLDEWFLGVGLRGDRFKTKAEENLKFSSKTTSTNQNEDYLPSGYATARYYFTNDMHMFGGIGHSVRIPTAVERYIQGSPSFFGNPDLKPTRNTELDLGFGMIIKRLNLKAKVFYSDLKDYIYQEQRTKGTISWTNIDAHIFGGDIKALVDIVYGFSAEGAIAYQRGKKDSQPNYNDDDNLAEIPPLKTKLALHYEDAGFFGVMEWIHSNKYRNADIDAGEKELPSWNVFNIRAGYTINEYLAFTVGVDNLFNAAYAVANSYELDPLTPGAPHVAIVNEPGRFYYFSLNFRF
jgi:iron complex outermembrane recepter protein